MKNFKSVLVVIVIVAIATLLFACSGGSDKDVVVTPIVEVEEEPVANPEDTIEGVDSDSDGVRDDVAEYIVATYDDEPTRDALMQYAKAEQDFILSDGNETLAVEAAHLRGKSIDCILSKHDLEEGWKIIKDANYAYLNTEERIRAYLAADSLLGGERFSVTPYDERAAMCE